MIRTETVTINGKAFVRTYSDKGMYIHGGMPEADYAEALDPADLGRTYTETETPVEDETDAEQILNILLGGGA